MAIPDVYVVPYLLQSTHELPSNMRWSDGESGAYVTNIRGVQVELGQLLSTTGSRYHVALSFNLEQVFIEEPRRVAFFRKRY